MHSDTHEDDESSRNTHHDAKLLELEQFDNLHSQSSPVIMEQSSRHTEDPNPPKIVSSPCDICMGQTEGRHSGMWSQVLLCVRSPDETRRTRLCDLQKMYRLGHKKHTIKRLRSILVTNAVFTSAAKRN